MNEPNDKLSELLADSERIAETIAFMPRPVFGVLESNFLRQSVSVLLSEPAISLHQETSLHEVLLHLQNNRIGCVLITNDDNRLVGIFGERDFMAKIYGQDIDLNTIPVSEYMTREPLCAPPDAHVAYVLNMMSHLGFRHVPIVTNEREPIGVVSIRDVVEYIAQSITKDLLDFETPGF